MPQSEPRLKSRLDEFVKLASDMELDVHLAHSLELRIRGLASLAQHG